ALDPRLEAGAGIQAGARCEEGIVQRPGAISRPFGAGVGTPELRHQVDKTFGGRALAGVATARGELHRGGSEAAKQERTSCRHALLPVTWGKGRRPRYPGSVEAVFGAEVEFPADGVGVAVGRRGG